MHSPPKAMLSTSSQPYLRIASVLLKKGYFQDIDEVHGEVKDKGDSHDHASSEYHVDMGVGQEGAHPGDDHCEGEFGQGEDEIVNQ